MIPDKKLHINDFLLYIFLIIFPLIEPIFLIKNIYNKQTKTTLILGFVFSVFYIYNFYNSFEDFIKFLKRVL